MDLLDEIVKRMSPGLLNGVVIVIVLLVVVLVGLLIAIVRVLRQALQEGRPIKFWWLFVGGKRATGKDTKGISTSVPPNAPSAARPRLFRKILYVKITCLFEKAPGAMPFYDRIVPRLKEVDRVVRVYDEAVYYTLDLFPTKRRVEARSDSSSGVVDSQMVIPWNDNLTFFHETMKHVKEVVQFDLPEESDTLLTVSHIENGLQGNNQNVASHVQEDAEYARLIVDFSSVPGASRFVKVKSGWVLTDRREPPPDAVSPDTVQTYGGTIFVLARKDVRKGWTLKMYFEFDWNLAPRVTLEDTRDNGERSS